jgi:prevent-host-death family protein
MRFEIILAPEAVGDFRSLRANIRSTVRDALETHLRHEPMKTSRSRIKRLRGLARPEYRLREVPLSEIKDDLSRFLREAGKQEIVITRHGKPAGVLIGFDSEDDWFDYKLENDPRFLERIEQARRSLKAGRGIRLEDMPK